MGSHSLKWYQAYNSAKHDRASNLPLAKLDHVLDAFCGLAVVLTSQYLGEDFSPANGRLSLEGPNDGSEEAIGSYLRINYPQNVPKNERYDFDWQKLMVEDDPFQKFDYDAL